MPGRSSATGVQHGKAVRTWPCWRLEIPTLPSMCTLLPNGDHRYRAMESLLWSPAKDHVTSSWAWSHLISTSGKALLSVITLGYFTLNQGSHTSSSAVLSWYVLICCWLTISMNRHAIQKQHSISKYPFTGGWEWKLSGGSSCWSWALRGKTEKLVLDMKVWPPPLPQKASLLLLKQSSGCIHEGNIFLWVLRQDWGEVFCPKTFSLWRSPLRGTMATLPSQVYPKTPVTDVLL